MSTKHKASVAVTIFAVAALATALGAVTVGTGKIDNDGFAILPHTITGITSDGETPPWKTTAGIYAFECGGTFDGASVKLQWRLHPDFTFEDMPNTIGPYTALPCQEGRIQLYNETEVRVDISGTGGSTDLSVVLRGPKGKE